MWCSPNCKIIMQPSNTVLVGHTIVIGCHAWISCHLYQMNLNCFDAIFHFRLDQFNKRCSWRIKYGSNIIRLITGYFWKHYIPGIAKGMKFSSLPIFKIKNKLTRFHVDSYWKPLDQMLFCVQPNRTLIFPKTFNNGGTWTLYIIVFNPPGRLQLFPNYFYTIYTIYMRSYENVFWKMCSKFTGECPCMAALLKSHFSIDFLLGICWIFLNTLS